MSKLTRERIKIPVSFDELQTFISIIKDLNKISNSHKISWIGDDVIFYSIKNESGTERNPKINQLKTFILKRNEVFSEFTSKINVKFTIADGKTFVNKYSLILDDKSETYNLELSYIVEHGIVELFKASSKVYKSITSVSGDDSLIRDFTIEQLKSRLDPENSENKFNLTFDKLKLLDKSSKFDNITISDNEDKLCNLSIKNGEVIFNGSGFELLILEDKSLKDGNWSFRSEYLKTITENKKYDHVVFSIFDTYISVYDYRSYMLMTLSL